MEYGVNMDKLINDEMRKIELSPAGEGTSEYKDSEEDD